jgi:LacI family transcriptional regulator
MTEGEGLIAGVSLWGQGGPHPTAVVCGSTRLAAGLLRGLEARGLRVPDDVSVVVHDDELPGLRARTFDPPLTATCSPLAQGWPPLARILARAVDGAPLDELQLVGEVDLIERNSVRFVSRRDHGNGSLTGQGSGVS